MMRIRIPFAGKPNTTASSPSPTNCLPGAFFVLLLLSAFLGLSSVQIPPSINDKVLHAVTFFVLTLVFYWIIDGSRRRVLNLTLSTCTVFLGVGSELVQAVLPNGRNFDLYDIAANIVGSLAALALCSWYHKRMLERKRVQRYQLVSGEEGDVELGEGAGVARVEDGGRETGVVERTLEEEVDNWDENAEDHWEGEEDGQGGDSTSGDGQKTPSRSSADGEGGTSESKK